MVTRLRTGQHSFTFDSKPVVGLHLPASDAIRKAEKLAEGDKMTIRLEVQQ